MAGTEVDEILERLEGQIDRAIKLAVQSLVPTEEINGLVTQFNAALKRHHELAAESLTVQPERQAEIKTQMEEILREVNRVAPRYQN